jgi:hypothetical protein
MNVGDSIAILNERGENFETFTNLGLENRILLDDDRQNVE